MVTGVAISIGWMSKPKKRPITKRWLAQLAHKLDNRLVKDEDGKPYTQASLARRVKTRRQRIGRLLAGHFDSSDLVDPITEVMQMDPPTVEVTNPKLLELYEESDGLPDEVLDAMIQMAKASNTKPR